MVDKATPSLTRLAFVGGTPHFCHVQCCSRVSAGFRVGRKLVHIRGVVECQLQSIVKPRYVSWSVFLCRSHDLTCHYIPACHSDKIGYLSGVVYLNVLL